MYPKLIKADIKSTRYYWLH